MGVAGGTNWLVFVGLTLVILGGAGYLTGQALASRWRPMWQLLPYGMLLGGADRFLVYGLFDGELFSVSAYAIDTVLIGLIAAGSYRRIQARKMVSQYPWLYKPRGVFGWRERSGVGG